MPKAGHGMLAWLEGGLDRRDPALVGGATRSEFTYSTLVEVAGEDDST